MKRAIRISNVTSLLDIYTVSYTPLVSNSYSGTSNTGLLQTIDLTGDNCAKIVKNNFIKIDKTRLSYNIGYMDTYLMIIMRLNTANQNYSPHLEEYMLVSGSNNIDKFQKDR